MLTAIGILLFTAMLNRPSRAQFDPSEYPEVPGAAAASDAYTLYKAVLDRTGQCTLAGGLRALAIVGGDHIDRFRSQLSYGCGARAGPMVKSVMSHLANAIECRDADLAESAVSTVRDLALLIHNEHGDRDGALALTEAVLKHREHLADHLVATLEEDAATLRRNIKLNTLTSALQSGHLKQADALADELLEDADEDRADTLLGLKSVIASRRQAKRDRIIGWGVLVAVVGGVAAFNGAVETTNPQGYAAESPGAVQASPLDNSYNAASVIVPGEPKSEGGSEALVEQMPAPNMGGLLSISELLYCQNQKVRIEAAEGAVSSQPQLRRFNRAVDDFNSRCSSYQYRQEDMNRVEADIAAARSRLQAEGRRLVGNPVFVQPAEEPVYENFGADPAKAEDDEADRDAN